MSDFDPRRPGAEAFARLVSELESVPPNEGPAAALWYAAQLTEFAAYESARAEGGAGVTPLVFLASALERQARERG
ncbi:MAG: hypothetical protein ACU0CO_18365 [Shimia sp.]